MKLLTWWTYVYLWLNFHWKTTGGSKVFITDPPRSKNNTCSTDLHFTWFDNNKVSIIRVINISGNLGTLKDRWNFWTFGIKFYKSINKQIRIKTHRHVLELFPNIGKYNTGNFLVVLKIPAGNSNKRDITQRKGTRKLNNLNDCFEINTYRKKYHQVNLSGLLVEKSHNTSYNIQINWKGIAGNHKLIDSINKFNILDRIYTMSSKSKAKKAARKSLGKRTKERVHALNQTISGTNEAESSEDEEI